MYFFYYFPTGLDIRTRRAPVITVFLALTCVITYLVYRYMPYGSTWDITNLIFRPDEPTIAASLAHVFLHSGWMHIAGNMVYLVVFGKVIEDRFGTARFFAIFALSAMAGAWTHLLLTRIFAPQFLAYGVVGASGATSGLLGAYVVRFYFSRIRVVYWIFMPLQGISRAGGKSVPGLLAIVFWIVYQGIYTIMQYGTGAMSVAYGVHIGGFACGAVLAAMFGAKAEARAERRLQKARRHFERAEWYAAQGEYLGYLDLMPRDAGVHAETARTLRCTGDTGTARYHYTESVELFLDQSDRGEAESVFSEAMRAIDGFTLPERMHLDITFGMERSLKYKGSLASYRNFMERYPGSENASFVLLRMAAIHERRFNRPGDALTCYRDLVDRFPYDSWTEFARSEIKRLESCGITLSTAGE